MSSELRMPADPALWAPFVEALPVTGGSISVMDASGLASTVSTSDALAAHLDAIQLQLGEGPHWDAFRSGSPVLAPDLADGQTQSLWPMFGNAVLETDARGVFSFPLVVGLLIVGVADLYSDTAGGRWPASLVASGAALAAASAAPAVRLATRSAVAEQSAAPAPAVELRREVHQATGMLIVQLEVPADEAMARLEAYAFSTGRPILEIARDVVHRRLDFRSVTG